MFKRFLALIQITIRKITEYWTFFLHNTWLKIVYCVVSAGFSWGVISCKFLLNIYTLKIIVAVVLSLLISFFWIIFCKGWAEWMDNSSSYTLDKSVPYVPYYKYYEFLLVAYIGIAICILDSTVLPYLK